MGVLGFLADSNISFPPASGVTGGHSGLETRYTRTRSAPMRFRFSVLCVLPALLLGTLHLNRQAPAQPRQRGHGKVLNRLENAVSGCKVAPIREKLASRRPAWETDR